MSPGDGAGVHAQAPASIEWLHRLLWPDAPGVVLAARVPSGARAWWMLPSPESPRLLVPVERGPAAASLRQFNNSMSQPARLRKAALGEVLRAGSRLVPMRRMVAPDGHAGDLIGSFLPGVFGVRSVVVSISVGKDLRPNLKPVLQVMTERGEVLGYVKLGWNDVTRRMLDNEARALRAWGASPPSSFRVPRLIHHGTWDRLTALVVSPVPTPLLRRGGRCAMPRPEVLREVASLDGGIHRAPLARSSFLDRVTDRVEATPMDPSVRSVASATIGALRADERDVAVGTWHGDWAPWNMTTAGGILHVWDWERSEAGAPLGLDALHFSFEVGYHKRSLAPAASLARGIERCRAVLEALRVEQELDALSSLYVLERLTRLEEGRAAAVRTDGRLRDWLIGRLGDPR
jgi:hypothetical protein